MPSRQLPHQPHPSSSTPPLCTIVPPYVLEALAASDDPHLAAHAQATLAMDAELRQDRWSTELRRPRSRSRRPRLERGTPDGPQRSIHDAEQGTDLPGPRVRGEGEPDTGDRAVTEAYDGLGATWDLWSAEYGRNSLDGKGLPLVATVHFGQDYDNAFWDGTQMVFGDGDGVVFLSFTRSLDVIGHELAHGVTQYTSGLNYRDQSGALNESISDVFGVLVKQRLLGQDAGEADWLVGAELLGPDVAGVGIRSMAAPGTAYDDPRLGKDPQPAHMRDFVDTADDNGGVHINSGIPNKAFHLLATALGGPAWEVAGQIWFDTITGDIRADCDFATFAGLTVAAAAARHGEGSDVVDAVRAAWDAVGLGEGAGVEEAGGRVGPKAAARSGPAGGSDAGGGADAEGGDGADAGAATEASPGPASQVSIRRTGGFAGRTVERTVTLGELPRGDARAWQSLLADDTLPALAEEAAAFRTVPDSFCYAVHCDAPPLEVELPETTLSADVRSLLERTLKVVGAETVEGR